MVVNSGLQSPLFGQCFRCKHSRDAKSLSPPNFLKLPALLRGGRLSLGALFTRYPVNGSNTAHFYANSLPRSAFTFSPQLPTYLHTSIAPANSSLLTMTSPSSGLLVHRACQTYWLLSISSAT